MVVTKIVAERKRTGWDVVLGILLLVAGFIILGHTVLATAVSVSLIAWLTFFSGIAALIAALFRIGRGGSGPP